MVLIQHRYIKWCESPSKHYNHIVGNCFDIIETNILIFIITEQIFDFLFHNTVTFIHYGVASNY